LRQDCCYHCLIWPWTHHLLASTSWTAKDYAWLKIRVLKNIHKNTAYV
jgi:hypothetical protein